MDTTTNDLFPAAQLHAELRHALYAPDRTLLGSHDDLIEARELAGRLSIERGDAVTIRALRQPDEVVDMPKLRRDAAEVLGWVLDTSNPLRNELCTDSREDIAAKLGAAIAGDSYCTLYDTLRDAQWDIGVVCMSRKCLTVMEAPGEDYCSRACWLEDDGDL